MPVNEKVCDEMKKFDKKTKIKTKLLLGMVGLSVAVSIFTGLIAGVVLYQNSYSNMVSSVTLASKAYEQALQNKIDQYKMAIEQVAQNDVLTNPQIAMEDKSAVLVQLAQKYGFVDISIANADGSNNAGTNSSDRDYFQKAMSGETYITSPTLRQSNSTIVLFVSTKVDSKNGYNGVVFGALASDTFSSMVDEATVGQTGYSYVMDKNGTIIAHKNRTVVTEFTNYLEKVKQDSSVADSADVTQNMVKGVTGGQAYTINGSKQYVAYRPIDDTDGWSIAVTAKTTEMMSGFYNSLYITIGVVLLFVIISMLVGFRVAAPIVNPIVKLVLRIEGMAEGDLHSEVPVVKNQDEIGTLANTFSNTVNTLNAYIDEIATVLGAIAQGDLTVQTEQDYKGDFVAIKTALDHITASLNRTFNDISQSAEQVASGADQVSAASQALSQGATEQASSIQELSATITEIADEVNKNAGNSATASKLSNNASAEVERGNEHMQQMIASMGEISESSSQIGKIIKTIEDIAFQTNILALNAAVEAARAGAAGKGFAVVADEVRNLASKSAEAAKNTTVLIEDSIRAVEKGTKIADETGKSLSAIIDGTRQTTDIISEISRASNDQATSINQITQGVDQISAVVQTNSATAEESAATSEELSGQAQMLKQMLAGFKLKDAEYNGAGSGEYEQDERQDSYESGSKY